MEDHIYCPICDREAELVSITNLPFEFDDVVMWFVRCNYCKRQSDMHYIASDAIDQWQDLAKDKTLH